MTGWYSFSLTPDGPVTVGTLEWTSDNTGYDWVLISSDSDNFTIQKQKRITAEDRRILKKLGVKW